MADFVLMRINSGVDTNYKKAIGIYFKEKDKLLLITNKFSRKVDYPREDAFIIKIPLEDSRKILKLTKSGEEEFKLAYSLIKSFKNNEKAKT